MATGRAAGARLPELIPEPIRPFDDDRRPACLTGSPHRGGHRDTAFTRIRQFAISCTAPSPRVHRPVCTTTTPARHHSMNAPHGSDPNPSGEHRPAPPGRVFQASVFVYVRTALPRAVLFCPWSAPDTAAPSHPRQRLWHITCKTGYGRKRTGPDAPCFGRPDVSKVLSKHRRNAERIRH